MEWNKLKIVLIIFAVCLYAIVFLFDKWNDKQKAKFKTEIDIKCDSILASAANTEATIIDARENINSLPEEYREEFLAKYDELEETIKRIKEDVEKVKTNFGNEVTIWDVSAISAIVTTKAIVANPLTSSLTKMVFVKI